ncbi:MAG: hypothetical protein ACD_60C00028G0024 [uncultured bacterium]|nr:MAG: hypothetical protein ACD_60C00028G0024 [uncultured bacterium]
MSISLDTLKKTLNHDVGYAIHFKLNEAELGAIRAIIKSQWLYRMQLLVPEHIAALDAFGMENYHRFAHLLDHSSSWPTPTRILSKRDVNVIKEMPFFNSFKKIFGSIEIADEAKFGWDHMLWRLVRPGNSDCASIHTDRWFWDLASDWKVPDYAHQRLNVWIAIHTVPGKNGLCVVPASQTKKDWKWHSEKRYGQLKPVLDEDVDQLGLKLLPTEPGDIVIFNHDLLHGGAPNLAETTRVSLEFTIFVPT